MGFATWVVKMKNGGLFISVKMVLLLYVEGVIYYYIVVSLWFIWILVNSRFYDYIVSRCVELKVLGYCLL